MRVTKKRRKELFKPITMLTDNILEQFFNGETKAIYSMADIGANIKDEETALLFNQLSWYELELMTWINEIIKAETQLSSLIDSVVILSEDQTAMNGLLPSISMGIKKTGVILTVLEILGNEWENKLIKKFVRQKKKVYEQNISRYEATGIKVKNAYLTQDARDEIKKDLIRVDGRNPLSKSYFYSFADYERYIEVTND